MATQLTPHFSLEELTSSDTGARLGIDNSLPERLMPNIQALAEGLEQVRLALGGRPIHINSGYRCPQLNTVIGGAKTSHHMDGLAADILCAEFGTPLQVCRAIVAAGIKTDQVIHEFGKWCHVGFAAPGAQPRGELLTIASAAKGYETGLNEVST